MPRGPRKPRLKVEKEKDDAPDIVVVRENVLRPSDAAIARLAPAPIANRQPIPPETPFMYRIYKETAQRATLHLKSLNSAAAFILVSDADKVVMVWVGQDCAEADTEYAITQAINVLQKDLAQYQEENIPVIYEGSERRDPLKVFLEKLWSDDGAYKSKLARAERAVSISDNAPAKVGLIERFSNGAIGFRVTGEVQPDARTLKVPRLAFPPIEVNTIACSQIGEHWDLWIARGASSSDERDAKAYTIRLILAQNGSSDPSLDAALASQYLHITRQGCERSLFRLQFKIFTDYEPPDRSLPWIPPKSLARRIAAAEVAAAAAANPSSGSVASSNGSATGAASKGQGKAGANSGLYELLGLNSSLVHTSSEMRDDEYQDEYAPPTAASSQQQQQSRGGGGGGGGGAVKWADEGRGAEPVGSPSGAGGLNLQALGSASPGRGLGRSSSSGAIGGTGRGNGYTSDVYTDLDAVGGEDAPRPARNEGRRDLRPDMLELLEGSNIPPEERLEVIKECARTPRLLMGWQVEIDEGRHAGIHVVTGVKKDMWHKSFFRLSSFEEDDAWLRLRRGSRKNGVVFRPLRKVF